MDTELQRQKYDRNAFKIELPTNRYVFSVMLHWNHTTNKLVPVLERHYHVRYEVRCLWEPDNEHVQAAFLIVPPCVWHTGRFPGERQGTHMTAFQFSVRERRPGDGYGVGLPHMALETFLKLQEPLELMDTFGGSRKLCMIRQELEQGDAVNYERLYAVFSLLMVELAQALPGYVPQKIETQKYAIGDFYPEIMEQFFSESYMDPACSREQLAKILCLSPSQVGRIVERLYHKSFRDVLIEVRMEYAQAWRLKENLSVDEVAKMVGYTSTRGFADAYKQYFGHEYIWRKERKE